MVERSFGARDNEALTIDSGSPNGTPGSPIINNSDTPVGTIFEYHGGFPNVTITLDDQSGDTTVFNDDQPASHIITDGQGIVPDGSQVESESKHYLRALDADGEPTGPTITVTVFSKGGTTQDIWGMSSDIPLQPGTRYVKTGGSNEGSSEYDAFVPCFAAGTLIRTPDGERPVETLGIGDAVATKDHGPQPVRLVARRRLRFPDSPDRLKPVVIRAGALGDGYPRRDLCVSPQHRIMLADDQGREVLCLAKGLTGLAGIRVASGCRRVDYVHLLFDRHEIVFAEGAATESFRPGPVAVGSLEAEVRQELLEIFPALREDPLGALGAPARPLLKLREVRMMVEHRTLAAGPPEPPRDPGQGPAPAGDRLAG